MDNFQTLVERCRARTDLDQVRLREELALIQEAGLVDTFCELMAKGESGHENRVNSLVAYAVGITSAMPSGPFTPRTRYVNARVSMPDIDIDFPDDRRHEMIEYAVRRYGDDKVAAIITFGTLGARAAVRDVGRALEVPLSEVDRVARMVPNVPGKPVNLKGLLFEEAVAEEWPSESAELREAYEKEPTVRELLDTAMTLEGQTRHASTHAAGIVISDKPIIEYAPLHRPTKGDDSGPIQKVVQFDMGIVESIGLLKVDFLGLATLSIMRRACEHIERRHGRKLDLNTIPYERCPEEPARDAAILAAYRLLQEGHTVGVFQVEGAGLRRVLQEMHPDQFEHIIAAISLYRPGPMEYIPAYIRRMHGQEEIAYHHKTLEEILGTTYGICVSGDAIVVDARTGERHRLADVGALENFAIQGVNERWEPAVGHVTHWIDSGVKPVYEVKLRNGATIKVTADHRLLTERGWMPLNELSVGEPIGVPPYLIGVEEVPSGGSRQPLWQQIISIEPAGEEAVFDLTVEGLHSFVADNVIVHNCVYQEQIMRMATDIAGYSPGEADLMRRAVSKKKAKDIEYHKAIFVAGAEKRGVQRETAERIYGDIEYFARYGFNKCLPGDVEVLDTTTGRLVRIEDLYKGTATLNETLTCDTEALTLKSGAVSQVLSNGVKPVFRLTTDSGRTIEATANHPFYTFNGWRLLEELREGELIATPRRIPVAGTRRVSGETLYGWANQLGNGSLGALPEALFELESEQLCEFFDFLNVDDAERRLTLPNQRIAQQLQHLLLRLGRLSTVASISGGFLLTVSEAEAALHERAMVAIMNPEGVATYVAGGEGARQPSFNSVKDWRAGNPRRGGVAAGARLAPLHRDDQSESDIYWDRIVAIEYVGEKATYDLTVPGTHNFVANDILVHNSHAADYAVITVQTAYLKAHYPVEYLCALLEIEFDDTDKVPIFLNECRRLGINVLPPDLNQSGARFTIEEDPTRAELPADDYRRWAIRVGMGAIKNVGLGAVEFIIAEREANGPFASLDDFCTRVDLRKINSRVLECLAKVGCFDNLVREIEPENPREIVCAVLDRMIATSGQHHAAADVGQLTMFDLFGGPSGPSAAAQSVLSPLPSLGRVDARARLDAEKELLGLYISDHPLKQVAAEVGRSITCFCGEMTLDQAGQSIVIAGLVSGVRVINTKKGDRMAFVKLEDLQGEAEVVVFPRTYEQARELLVNDTILLVRGKVEERNERLSVLADVIQRYEAEVPITIGLGSGDEPPPPLPFDGMPMEMPPLPGEAVEAGPSLLDSVQHHVTLTLERSADDGADVQRVQRVLHALRQFAGEDRFSLQIRHDGRTTMLDFPELRSSWNAHLRDLLIGQGISFELRDLTPDPRARFRKQARA